VPRQEAGCERLIRARRSGTCAESLSRGSHVAQHFEACLVDLPFHRHASEERQLYVDHPASSHSGALQQVAERPHRDLTDLKRSSLGGTGFDIVAPSLCTRRRATLTAENERSLCLCHLVPTRPYRGRTRRHSSGMVLIAAAPIAKTLETQPGQSVRPVLAIQHGGSVTRGRPRDSSRVLAAPRKTDRPAAMLEPMRTMPSLDLGK
jgi:hypothetical protein